MIKGVTWERMATARYVHPHLDGLAGDVASSTSWHVIETTLSLRLGQRSLHTYLHRPDEELYDISKDPNALTNLTSDPAYR